MQQVQIDPVMARLKRMRRSVLTAARLLRDEPIKGYRSKWAMLTLTYRAGLDWQAKHVTSLIKAIRDYLSRRGFRFRYVWVAELQKRGAVHYHVLIQLPKGLTLPKPDKRGWWPHGSTRIEWARHAVGYIAKYASKGGELTADPVPAGQFPIRFPKGCRLNGCGGLSRDSRREKAWWLAPSYVRDAFGALGHPVRAPGGGWLCRSSGEWLPAQWVIVAASRLSVRLVPAADLLRDRPVLPSIRPWRRIVVSKPSGLHQ